MLVEKRIPEFTRNLKELLKRSELTVTAFADRIGITRQALTTYLNDGRIPDSETLLKICKAFHISADWLLGLSTVSSVDKDLQSVCKYTGLSELSVTKLIYAKNLPIIWGETIKGIEAFNYMIENGGQILQDIYNYIFADFSHAFKTTDNSADEIKEQFNFDPKSLPKRDLFPTNNIRFLLRSDSANRSEFCYGLTEEDLDAAVLLRITDSIKELRKREKKKGDDA